MAVPTGKVYLVGSGPGDPGLLTLRGRELLARADVVLYDYLANPLLMRHAQADAELICLGRHGQAQGRGRIVDQEDIHRQMVAAAQNGKQVVRLKGGDPGVFGRMGEELAALEAAGVAYEIVPGVTAALAASSYSGVPLTHRDHASCVALITGQESRMKSGSKLDMAGLARFPGTLVFYMGVTTAPDWSSELIAHGKPGDTPVAIVRHASLPTQKVLTSTLGELASVLAPGKIRPPAIIVVGEAVVARSTLQWFSSRPLFGRQVLVARPEHQAAELTAQLSELGASVLLQPGISINEPKDWQPVDEAISRFAEYDWLVFSSVNGVNYFLERLLKSGSDLRSLSGIKLASVGPGTTEALAAFHLKADLQPDEYRAEALAEALSGEAEGNRFLLLRASRGREVLAELLRSAGAEVEQVVVYQSSDVIEPAEEVGTAMATGKVDWTLVTSSAIARSLIAMFGEQLHQTRLAAISPITADVLSEAGYSPTVVAEQHTPESLLVAILAAETAG
ncbi:uroporphyrinogen-III C-methyltransferase [Adhaeretor mobilis]|uniref:uroporphyrinogen-III C-methyltransferase n=1 Tax=Adhaeretor mobilis TaxID=1930276 RepID=A0A517MZ95_9BACT|nr:uroporphyrinogen-III C-methyltransferase [Adhaeretor mobilis]QDT00200.1 Uroporphyrinogen-III C-methyltransferase [Adhaeretor mobilis]